MTTSARKNQNGIKKAKSRLSRGCCARTSKATATQRKMNSRDAKRFGIRIYRTRSTGIYNRRVGSAFGAYARH